MMRFAPSRCATRLVALLLLAALSVAHARDFYRELGVRRLASVNEIKAAYRELAKKFHPDKNKEAGADVRFQRIAEAYETLSDPEKRRLYDMHGDDYANVHRQQEQRRQHHQQFDPFGRAAAAAPIFSVTVSLSWRTTVPRRGPDDSCAVLRLAGGGEFAPRWRPSAQAAADGAARARPRRRELRAGAAVPQLPPLPPERLLRPVRHAGARARLARPRRRDGGRTPGRCRPSKSTSGRSDLLGDAPRRRRARQPPRRRRAPPFLQPPWAAEAERRRTSRAQRMEAEGYGRQPAKAVIFTARRRRLALHRHLAARLRGKMAIATMHVDGGLPAPPPPPTSRAPPASPSCLRSPCGPTPTRPRRRRRVGSRRCTT